MPYLEACTAVSMFSQVEETGSYLYVGTRTHTVIVIDAQNNVTFIEKTMESPINVEDIHWNTNVFQFKIQK